MKIQVAAQTPGMMHKGKIAAVHGITTCNQTTTTTTTTINDTSRSTLIPPDICDNWVRNMSKTPLTKAEKSLLGHGPNFVMIPKDPPMCDYIAATEKACQNLSQGKVEELRGEIKQLLMKNHTIKPNIHKEEYQALKQLKKDNNRMVLTADKGVSMVVMDRDEYNRKSEELLEQPNYKIIQTDPTNKYKKNRSIGPELTTSKTGPIHLSSLVEIATLLPLKRHAKTYHKARWKS